MRLQLSALALLVLAACGAPPQETALLSTKSYVQENLTGLHQASTALCEAAPTAAWNGVTDRAAIDTMKARWKEARVHYERVEGAIAVLFPELDAATDERYDGFLESEADLNLFDDQVVTGVHAIERILWADAIPAEVVTFEQGLGSKYVPAAFPATTQEAQDFKTKLCARLVKDTKTMRDDFAPLALDTPAAFRGVIGSMEEQLEKTSFAATGEEESRYAQHTLADMRANLEGAVNTYEAFAPWLLSLGKTDLDKRIRAGFARVKAGYDAVPGEALPRPPSTWSSLSPSAADRLTPFGKLYTLVEDETNPARDGSLVKDLSAAADALGIPQLPAN
ncbi:MAG: EfeM/EfeO family lipoprotein [Myxococcota bacterium]